MLYQFALPPTVQEGALFSTPSPAFIIHKLFDDGQKDLFKKTRDTKETFHAKVNTIKDRNGMDLTEAEDIKKRWQEYTEELYKKDLYDPDNHNGVITHLEPANLENSAVATGLVKVSFHPNPKERAMPKNIQTTIQLCSFHMLARLCSKSKGYSSLASA